MTTQKKGGWLRKVPVPLFLKKRYSRQTAATNSYTLLPSDASNVATESAEPAGQEQTPATPARCANEGSSQLQYGGTSPRGPTAFCLVFLRPPVSRPSKPPLRPNFAALKSVLVGLQRIVPP